jgi:Cu/Ag efflux pump CusA
MKNPLDENGQRRTLADVVVDGAASRLRPIVLTTITTVIGMIPLAGASALWGPLAFAIMFGLTFAMILTLILTPILVYRSPGKQYWQEEPARPEARNAKRDLVAGGMPGALGVTRYACSDYSRTVA